MKILKNIKLFFIFYFTNSYIQDIKDNVDELMKDDNATIVNIKIGTLNIRRYKKYDMYNFERIELKENIDFSEYMEIIRILTIFKYKYK